MQQLQKLSVRHHEMLRLRFLGMSHKDIALRLGITPMAVQILMSSPMAKYELIRLKEEADKNVTDVNRRAEAAMELNRAGLEAIKLNRRVMNDNNVDVRLRTRLGQHFMDRVVFDKMDGDSEKASFKDILRGIGRLEEKLDKTTIIAESEEIGKAS